MVSVLHLKRIERLVACQWTVDVFEIRGRGFANTLDLG
jgi:hypothetical protein